MSSSPRNLRALEWLTRLDREAKRTIVFLADSTLCVGSVVIAYGLRLGILAIWNVEIAAMSLLALAIMIPVFTAMRVYSAIFRYAGRGAIRTLTVAGLIYTPIYASVIGFGNFPNFPRTVGLIQPVIFLALVVNIRLLARFLLVDLLNRNTRDGVLRNVLIYGTGRSGQRLAASVRPEPSFRLIGYVDDDARLEGQNLDGITVFNSARLDSIVARYGVTDILLALPGLSRTERREIVERLTKFNLHVQTLPEVKDIIEGNVSVSDIKELEIEDLLGREPVLPNQLLLSRTVVGKTVMVTGAGGSIGSELCRQILSIDATRLVLFEISEFALYKLDRDLARLREESGLATEIHPVLGSVLDEQRIAEVIADFRPDTIYHAAAYKHVPLVEANPVEGIRNNVLGTANTARAAQVHGVANFILISTDKAVRPTNIMGASKRAAELVIQALAEGSRNTRLSMVRFGNVLGSSGSVVPLFRSQIAEGGPITLTHRDVTRYFMTIPEAAQLVLQAAGLARGGEVFVLDMGEPVRIFDLATSMISLSGLTVRDERNPEGDIAIEEVGLRPGEKLYEELLIGDNPEKTSHPRIMKAVDKHLPLEQINNALEKFGKSRDSSEVLALLSRLVPEFAPENAQLLRMPVS